MLVERLRMGVDYVQPGSLLGVVGGSGVLKGSKFPPTEGACVGRGLNGVVLRSVEDSTSLPMPLRERMLK